VFESAETGRTVSKAVFEQREPSLRVDLINAQFDLRVADFSVLILLLGDDRAGCNETVGLLHEWLDARYIHTHFFGPPSDEELERPRFWRYWRALPPSGSIGVYLGAWSLAAIADRAFKRIGDGKFDRRIAHIRELEQALSDNGTLLLKYWLHLPKKVFRKRLAKAAGRDDVVGVESEDWKFLDVYDDAMKLAERLLRKTDTPHAPWTIIESTDHHHRDLAVATSLLEAINARLAARPAAVAPDPAFAGEPDGALSAVDLSKSLDDKTYKRALRTQQRKLSALSRKARTRGRSSVVVFEGWDAAGKGGTIRRLTAAMSPRDYVLVPIAAPTDEEKAHHYMWRFWRHLPRAGRMIVYDRSWYGRVLVERVEGFARPDEWQRAYGEINDFEEQLVEHGMAVVKFWLHMGRDEQQRRFAEREKTPYKKYKITDDDYRNRQKWPEYVLAVNEMVERTSTEIAPWHLVPANDKQYARVEVIRTVIEALGGVL